MTLKLFNTFTGRMETFTANDDNNVRMYTCGPTVYDYAHIGNFRAYVFEDLLRRYLKFKGYNVTQVMNLTDIDDKTINGAKEKGVSLDDYTREYIDAFFEDINSLNIEKAEHYPRATEHIDSMLDLVKTLVAKGNAYVKDGSVYFRVASSPNYGALSKKDLEKNVAGARVDSDEYEKEAASDFALWKKTEGDEPGWDSEFGRGRPGWHIECSAMGMELLGPTLDIHTGGEDNIFPHHENEMAQSEAATGKRFVRYWLHCRFLLVNGEKMSKSKGNFFTLRDLLAKGYDPIAIRYLLISHNYRHPLNFTLEGLEQAQRTLQRLDDFFNRLTSYKPRRENKDCLINVAAETRRRMEEKMDEDLNVSAFLACLFDFVSEANAVLDKDMASAKDISEAQEVIKMADRILGLKIYTVNEPPPEIITLIEERNRARREKNFEKSDELRREIFEMGWILKDGRPGEPSVYKKRKRVWEKMA